MEIKRANEDEQDATLRELFRSIEPPSPSPDFVLRTMKAVRAEPLPAGRQPLRHPWITPLGWMVLLGAAAAIAAVIVSQPIAAKAVVSMAGFTLRACEQLGHFIHAGLALSTVLAAVGRAVAHVAATEEGTTTLIVTAVVACTSLAALQRLLFSQGEDSQWQELS